MSLPFDVWAMMIFSILAFFGVSIWTLIYTLRQEDRKMRILRAEDALDTHSPAALRDLRRWIEAHPDDPDVEEARDAYNECVDALHSMSGYLHDWTEAEVEALERL